MTASSTSAPSSMEKLVAKQGVDQNFLAENQKETPEMDQMIGQQQQSKGSDASSVGSLDSFSLVDLTSEVSNEEIRELSSTEVDQIQIEETNLRA